MTSALIRASGWLEPCELTGITFHLWWACPAATARCNDRDHIARLLVAPRPSCQHLPPTKRPSPPPVRARTRSPEFAVQVRPCTARWAGLVEFPARDRQARTSASCDLRCRRRLE